MWPTPGETAGLSGARLTKRRNQEAIRQGWKCYWCKGPMTQIPYGTGKRRFQKGDAYPLTMVTLDHLFAKGDPRRLVPPRPGEHRYVAACRRCNEERGKIDEIKFRRSLDPLQKHP
jgi:hypothetical protein